MAGTRRLLWLHGDEVTNFDVIVFHLASREPITVVRFVDDYPRIPVRTDHHMLQDMVVAQVTGKLFMYLLHTKSHPNVTFNALAQLSALRAQVETGHDVSE